MRHILSVLSLAVVLLAQDIHAASASEKIFCTCYFQESSGYTAVGTRSACSAMTRRSIGGKGERCEISFGATGADASLVGSLKLDPNQYRRTATELTLRNFAAIESGNVAAVSDPEYLRAAIPAYFRAVYLRQSADLNDDVRADINRQTTDFVNDYAPRIAAVFAGREAPFDINYRDRHSVSVTQGAIRFVYDGGIFLVAVFFEAPR